MVTFNLFSALCTVKGKVITERYGTYVNIHISDHPKERKKNFKHLMDQRAADLARGANNAAGSTRDLKNCVVARIKNMAPLRLALVAVGNPAWLTTTAYEDACREAVGLIPDNARNRDDLAMTALTYLMTKNFDRSRGSDRA